MVGTSLSRDKFQIPQAYAPGSRKRGSLKGPVAGTLAVRPSDGISGALEEEGHKVESQVETCHVEFSCNKG